LNLEGKMSQMLFNSTDLIEEIVRKNYHSAFVLYSLGIPFYTYEQLTLEEVCKQKKIELDYVLLMLSEANFSASSESRKLKNASVETIVGYLKHQHIFFLQKKIPFIAHLIENLPEKKRLFTDLQLMFPLFAEDFIHHIHEEEDTFFYYILSLVKASKNVVNKAQLYDLLQRYSTQEFALAHDTHDDEMQGIRQLTNHYQLPEQASLYVQVVYFHLQDLETHLQQHAYIENEILFPKALVLENTLKQDFFEQSKWN